MNSRPAVGSATAGATGATLTITGAIAAVVSAPPGRAARATTIIFSGVWLGASAAVSLRLALPALPAGSRAGVRGLFSVLRVPQVTAGLAITALLVVGHFSGYTFIRPLLEFGGAHDEGRIAAALLAFGIAGVIGNFCDRRGSFSKAEARSRLHGDCA